MLSSFARLALYLLVAAGLSSTAAVLYSQPPSTGGVFYPSSSSSNDYDQFVWDDFTLLSTHAITEIQWRGGYDPKYAAYAGPVVDFIVGIYGTSIAGEPDVASLPLAEFQAGGNANETFVGTFGGIPMYDYTLVLPSAFSAEAGVKYWVQIEASQAGVPNWGITDGTGGDGTHFWAFVNYAGGLAYRWGSGDAAFTLLGPAAGLSAHFSASPTTGQVPLTVTFTNTSAGTYSSSLWDFGEGITSSLPSPTHTFAATGQYTVALTVGGPGGTDTLTKTNLIIVTWPLSAITVAPDPIIVPVGAAQVFTATATDIYSNAVAINPVWSTDAGTMTGNRLTAQTTPSVGRHVTATVGSLSGIARVNIVAGPLALITVAPDPVTLSPGVTQTFMATGLDGYDNAIAINPTWSTDAGTMVGNILTAQIPLAAGRHITATVGNVHGIAVVNIFAKVAFLPIVWTEAITRCTGRTPQVDGSLCPIVWKERTIRCTAGQPCGSRRRGF
jgi:PKD repeat protein